MHHRELHTDDVTGAFSTACVLRNRGLCELAIEWLSIRGQSTSRSSQLAREHSNCLCHSFFYSLLSSSSLLAPSSSPPLSHAPQESDAQAASSEVGQLDLLEAGPAEDGSEQAEQVRLFLAGEHDIMQKVFAGQEEEEEKRGTQVEIEVRAFCVEAQSCRGGWKLVISDMLSI